MKALTVYQPWTTLIVAGAKPFEFRGHRAPKTIVGERIVIHAAKRLMVPAEVQGLWLDLHGSRRARAETCLDVEMAIAVLRPLIELMNRLATPKIMEWMGLGAGFPTSAGLGTAIVGEPRDGIEIAEEFGLERANDSDRDQHANFGWPMLEVERWEKPIPARGMQGIWTWPTPADAGL